MLYAAAVSDVSGALIGVGGVSILVKDSGGGAFNDHSKQHLGVVCPLFSHSGGCPSTSGTCTVLGNLHFANQHAKCQNGAVSDKNSSLLTTSRMTVESEFSLVKLKVFTLYGERGILSRCSLCFYGQQITTQSKPVTTCTMLFREHLGVSCCPPSRTFI